MDLFILTRVILFTDAMSMSQIFPMLCGGNELGENVYKKQSIKWYKKRIKCINYWLRDVNWNATTTTGRRWIVGSGALIMECGRVLPGRG